MRRIALTALLPLLIALPQLGLRASEHEIVLTASIEGTTNGYIYLPFEMPAGVSRIDVSYVKSGEGAATGIGIFDTRGPGYQTEGFRGFFGTERKEFFIEGDEASESFVPGPIEPGEWTVVIAVFSSLDDTEVTVTVEPTLGEIEPTPAPDSPGVVDADRGWYRGDLHAHSIDSSDAFVQMDPLTQKGWGAEARQRGLDFVSMTDHNVFSQNLNLEKDAGKNVLLIPGEEMTNYFFGHSTITGLSPGEWLDFRQRPVDIELRDNEGRMADMFSTADALGTYSAIAHPFQVGGGNKWSFFYEIDTGAMPDGVEIWTGFWSFEDTSALSWWDGMLADGYRIWANGGSDTHGLTGENKPQPGEPTTVTYAAKLSPNAVVSALEAGRMYITSSPKGPGLILVASGPGGRVMSGGTIGGPPEETVKVCVKVTKPAEMKLLDWRKLDVSLWRDGAVVATKSPKDEVQTFRFKQVIGEGGYVRAEIALGDPDGIRVPQALSNPIFLETGGLTGPTKAVPQRPAC